MNKRSLTLLFFSLIVFVAKIQATPFPTAQLDKNVLEDFYPEILKELEKGCSLQNDGRTHRNTLEYGYSFFKLESGNYDYLSPPPFLHALGNQICKCLGHPPQEFTNIIISLYEKGFHLEPHVDINSTDYPHKEYYFDENVYGLIVEADSTGRLYFVCHDSKSAPSLELDPIYILEERPGTVFCLQGEYRKAPYHHAVSKVSKRRISITFRKVVFEDLEK